MKPEDEQAQQVNLATETTTPTDAEPQNAVDCPNEEAADAAPAKSEPIKRDLLSVEPVKTSGARERELRKSSVVSFQEKCDFFEIHIEKDERPPKRPPIVFSLRFYIMVLALISPFIVTYSRTIINFAIIDMIDQDFLANSSKQKQEVQPQSLNLNTTLVEPETDRVLYFDRDNSCPISEENRARLLEDISKNKKRAIDRPGEKFKWDTWKQGLLKAAYAVGHACFQVLGGRLSEIHGSHRTMSISSALIGISCLMAPFLASVGFYLLLLDLLLLGIWGSFMTPSLITMFANWLTPSEKSIMLSLYIVSSRFGYSLSSLLCGLLIDAQLSWRYIFYSAGWVSLGFSSIFVLLARNTPQDHPLMKDYELDYLAYKNTLVREALNRRERDSKRSLELSEKKKSSSADTSADQQVEPIETKPEKRKTSAPWVAILTNRPVWAFILVKFCVKLAGDTVQIELPNYLNLVMHVPPKANGYINSFNYLIFCVSCLLIGAVAKIVNKKRPFGWTKTTVRKIFQSTASLGVAIVLLGLSFSVCHTFATYVLLAFLFFLTTFSTGGEAQIPLDLSERYAGTIHAIGSSLAISGIIEPLLVGYYLQGHAADRDRWSLIWFTSSGISMLGGLFFLVFGEATIQPFDSISEDTTDKTDKQEIQKKGLPKNNSFRTNGSENKAFENDEEIGKANKEVPREKDRVISEDHEAKNTPIEAHIHRESRQI